MPAEAPIQITASESKTRLSELLRRVGQGERFLITLCGRAVAELAPPEQVAEAFPLRQQFTEEEREAAYQRLRHPQIHGISGDEVLAAIREGRR
jgi:antitoxin (DNA-binding transcriptional repressor) of toxin-antitoxin stability system